MANVLTAEYVEQSTRAINSWLGGESGFVNELRDSHEAIRAERDEARRERDEWRERAERAEAAARDSIKMIQDEFGALGPYTIQDIKETLRAALDDRE